jgi:hypothetical protein
MRFIYLFVISSLLFPSLVKAQKKSRHNIFHIGVNAVSVRSSNAPFIENSYLKPVINLGFGIDYSLNEKWHFQPEIRYNPRGFQAKFNATDSTFASNSLELHYLDFCPNFSYVFGNPRSTSTCLSVWGGPYVGLGIMGKNVFSGTTLNAARTRADSTFNYTAADFNNGLKRLDYGVNVGAGLQFEGFTQIGISYSMGFNNISNSPFREFYNRSWGFYIRVLFDDMF